MSSAASLGSATAGSESRGNPLSDLERLQLQQAVETYRAQLSLMVQILTILVIADITLVGYAVTAKSAVIVAIGTAFPLECSTSVGPCSSCLYHFSLSL